MTVPIYLAECAPAHMRGRLTVADNAAITCGQFVAGVVDFGFSFLRKGGWRYVCLILLAVSIHAGWCVCVCTL